MKLFVYAESGPGRAGQKKLAGAGVAVKAMPRRASSAWTGRKPSRTLTTKSAK